MSVRRHLDMSLTSRHHESSGTDSSLPKTTVKSTVIKKRPSIKIGVALTHQDTPP